MNSRKQKMHEKMGKKTFGNGQPQHPFCLKVLGLRSLGWMVAVLCAAVCCPGATANLQSCIQLWKNWSDLVGVKESGKAQRTAKSKKNRRWSKPPCLTCMPKMRFSWELLLGAIVVGMWPRKMLGCRPLQLCSNCLGFFVSHEKGSPIMLDA